jgi:hypothetical protein
MTRRALTSVFTATAMAVALPLLAQDKGGQGARPNPGGGSTGSAVPSGSGGSSGSSGGGSSSSSPSSGGGSSASRPSGGGGDGGGYRAAPSRPERRGEGRAVERSSNGGSRGGEQRVAPSGASAASGSDNTGDRRRAVPAYSRPRDGRTAIGTAVTRVGRPPVRGDGGYYYDPFNRYSYYYNRYPYGYYWPGYGMGIGYFYDPWMWGYGSPYGYGGGGYYDDPYSGYGGGYSRGQYRDVGSIRLKVKPEYGQVYIDGYYVGEVDSFDGVFQKLPIEAGAHRVEIRAEGYETAQFEVLVIRGETVTYKGDLKRK